MIKEKSSNCFIIFWIAKDVNSAQAFRPIDASAGHAHLHNCLGGKKYLNFSIFFFVRFDILETRKIVGLSSAHTLGETKIIFFCDFRVAFISTTKTRQRIAGIETSEKRVSVACVCVCRSVQRKC